MTLLKCAIRTIAALALTLAFSGCILSSSGPAVVVPTQTAPAITLSATEPTVATAGAYATIAAAPTAAPSDTATPTAASLPAATATPTASPGVPVITAQNAANMSASSLTLPEWAGQFLWPPAGAPLNWIPGGATPDLLAKAGDTIYPVQFNPPAVGTAFKLNAPGQVAAIAPDLSSLVYMDSASGRFSLASMDGKPLAILDEIAPYNASYAPDSKLLAVTSQNEHAVTLYQVPSGQRLTRLTGFESAAPVYDAGILPGDQIIYWHARASLKLQDIASGTIGKEFSYTDFINQILFTPDGQHMILSVADKLYLYTVPAGDTVGEITLSLPLRSLSLSPDGKLLASGYGEALQIWDAASLAPVANFPTAVDGQVEFSADGKHIVSQQEGNILNIWSVKP